MSPLHPGLFNHLFLNWTLKFSTHFISLIFIMALILPHNYLKYLLVFIYFLSICSNIIYFLSIFIKYLLIHKSINLVQPGPLIEIKAPSKYLSKKIPIYSFLLKINLTSADWKKTTIVFLVKHDTHWIIKASGWDQKTVLSLISYSTFRKSLNFSRNSFLACKTGLTIASLSGIFTFMCVKEFCKL